MLENEAHFAANLVQKPTNGNAKADATAAVRVPVFFHVITVDGTANGGNLPYVYALVTRRNTH